MKLGRFVIAICILSGSLERAYSVDYLQKIAVTSDPAPWGNSTMSFTGFFTLAKFNDAGQILFECSVGHNSVNSGAWLFNGSGLEFVSGHNTAVPFDVDGAYATSSQVVDMNAAGQITVISVLYGGTVDSTNNAIGWTYGGAGGPRLIARKGNSIPGSTNGLLIVDVSYPYINDLGQVLYGAMLAPPGQTTVQAYETVLVEPNGVSKALGPHEGDHAPGFASDVTFRLIGNTGRLNVLDQRTIEGYLVGGGFDSTLGNDRGLWLAGPSGDLKSIGQNGLAAPGAGSGVVFNQVSQYPVLNGAGQFAFSATLRGPGVVAGSNDYGLWSNNGGNGVELVFRSGAPVPGFPGAHFTAVSDPKINEAGKLVFLAWMDQGLFAGLWTESIDHQLSLIQRDGAPAPGVPTPIALSDYFINDAGRVAFLGFIGGTTGMQGIWAQDAFGELKLIAKSGDQIDVGGVGTPNVKTIDTLYFGGFDDSRQVAFSVLFTDRTGGVFISHLAEVPEPKGLGIVFLCFGLLFVGERLHPPRQLTRFCGRTFP